MVLAREIKALDSRLRGNKVYFFFRARFLVTMAV